MKQAVHAHRPRAARKKARFHKRSMTQPGKVHTLCDDWVVPGHTVRSDKAKPGQVTCPFCAPE